MISNIRSLSGQTVAISILFVQLLGQKVLQIQAAALLDFFVEYHIGHFYQEKDRLLHVRAQGTEKILLCRLDANFSRLNIKHDSLAKVKSKIKNAPSPTERTNSKLSSAPGSRRQQDSVTVSKSQ